jgi:hypothetical protein
MRARLYLLALLISAGGAAYFGSQGKPAAAVLVVVPGYLVFAYVLIMISTFLPGAEKRRFQTARAAALRPPQWGAAPGDTVMYPAYLGAVTVAAYSGSGHLGWPEGDNLRFRALLQPVEFGYTPRSFRGFQVEAVAPAFLLDDGSPFTESGGPVVKLNGDSSANMVQIWVQPGDAESFIARLRRAGVQELDRERPRDDG